MYRGNLASASAAFAFALAIVGCDQVSPTSNIATSRSPAVSSVATPSEKYRTIDDDFADIAAQAPGFGGLFYDASGTLNVYLTNRTRTASLNAPMAALLQRRHLPTGRAVRILQGQFDYRDLLRGYQALHSLTGIFERGSGVNTTDIDERQNRIVIGVRDEAARQQVLAAVSRTPSIVSGSFIVEISPPVIALSTLQWYQDPDEGGEQIGTASFYCTNGFNAYRVVNGVVDTSYAHRYFITAAHCTDSFGTVTGMTIGQPDASVPKGTEVADPPLLTHSTNMYCPVGRNCRWSDAAVFQYISYISWRWPYILKVCSGITICGSTEMQVETLSSAVGVTVQAMGRTSGWRSGPVINTCVDAAESDEHGDTGRTMLCQEEATFNSQPGDSGGPVYRSDSQYQAAGIFWGSDGTHSFYSPIGGLQADGLKYTTALHSSLAP